MFGHLRANLGNFGVFASLNATIFSCATLVDTGQQMVVDNYAHLEKLEAANIGSAASNQLNYDEIPKFDWGTCVDDAQNHGGFLAMDFYMSTIVSDS